MSTVLPSKILPLLQKTPDRPLDLDAVRTLCYSGLSNCAWEDRAIAWLLLSCVLPATPSHFQTSLDACLSSYMAFTTDFGLTDYHIRSALVVKDGLEFGVPQEKLMYIIHGDVSRSGHHSAFLPESGETSDSQITHLRRVERILYIFATINPSLGYLQGFHELCCVLYYVFMRAAAWLGDDMMKVETAVFCCFQQLLGATRLQELFQTEDEFSLVHHQLNEFMKLLECHLPNVAATLAGFQLDPLSFALRWLNLLFAQDHILPDLLILWDALFAHFDRLVWYTMYIGIAHVKMIEEKIKPKSYFETIEALQNPQVKDVQEILHWTKRFWDSDREKSQRSAQQKQVQGRRN